MTTETVTRQDNHLIWELPTPYEGNDDASPVVLSAVVRTHTGETVALTRNGSLAQHDHTEVAVQVVGLAPRSHVVVNGRMLVADDFGRVAFVENNSAPIRVEFSHGGASDGASDGALNTALHSLAEHATTAIVLHTSPPQATPFFATPAMSAVYIVIACVVACCVPALGMRQWRSGAI